MSRKYGLENSHSHSVIYMPGGFHNWLERKSAYKTGEISIGIDRAESEGYFLSEGQEGGTKNN